MPCTTVTSLCSEGKVMLLLSVVRNKVLCLDTYDTDTIDINKICELNFRYFTLYLVISKQQGQGF